MNEDVDGKLFETQTLNDGENQTFRNNAQGG